MDLYNILKTLSETPGPSGNEESIRNTLVELWRPFVDNLHTDALGNLIALKRGSGAKEPPRRIMIAAHMDEIGLLVTGIEGEFLRCHEVRGIDRRILMGLQVCVHGRRSLPGVIGSRPPHVLPTSERQNIPPWHELFIDVGLSSDEIKDLVRVGDAITVQQPLLALKNDRVAGKAMDNRASVAALTLTLEALSRRDHTWDVYAVATAQEEMGVKGATTSAYGIAPELAIALDVTFAKQHNDTNPGTFELDKGPALGVGPNFHPALIARIREVAKKEEIAFDVEPLPGSSGTDAWAIQITQEGVPVCLISIPVRYMHQPVETLALRDVERTARWVTSFITGLEPDFRPRWEDEL